MSVKLRLKNSLLYFLDKLPSKWGFYCYHIIQQKMDSNNFDLKLNRGLGAMNVISKILAEINSSLDNKSITEIGSGWLPVMPYLLKYQGNSKSIYTYDLYDHYSAETIKDFNTYFVSKTNANIDLSTLDAHNLPEDIHYFPKKNIIETAKIESDVIFSRYVLEHVTPQDIELMHKKFALEMPKNSLIIHLISPSDHRAYVDSSLSMQDFLKFSEKEWKAKMTKFDYHNRLRLPEYLEIFEKCGLEVAYLNYDVPKKDSATYKKFKNLKLHQDYHKFTEEELMAGAINIVLKV